MGESIDLKWLEGVLKEKWYKDITELVSAELEPAVTAGENYVSKLYRVKLTVRTKQSQERTIKIILKRRIEHDIRTREDITMKLNEAFNLEHEVYENILKKIEKYFLRVDKSANIWPNFIAKIHNHDIYMEDLKESDYRLSNRQEGLDIDHCLLVFQNLAQFHASSYIALSKREIDLTPYMSYLISDSFKDLEKAHKDLLHVIIKDWGPQWESLADKFEKLGVNMDERMNEMKCFDERRINVLNHGDPWVNNMMFQYDEEGKPASLKFVDFQVIHYNSFAYDLCYFLSTSVTGEFKEKHLDTLISTYCQAFESMLEQHGSSLPAPTVAMVNQELLRLAPFSLEVTVRIRPIIMVPPEDSIPLSELTKEENFDKKKKIFNNPNLINVLKKDLTNFLTIL